MKKIRYAVVGNGWRAMFFVRAALNLPEIFELTGVLCRSEEKARAFAEKNGVKAFWDLDKMLETKPDFVVSCLTKAAMPAATMELLRRGVPVLSETPLATDEKTLREMRDLQRQTGTPLDMAEQYFLYPNHQARRALIEKGIVGDVHNVWMSMMHDYHGISMLRAYLGEESGDVTIRARKLTTPIVHTGGRPGLVAGGEIENEYRVLAQFDFGGGRVGLHDFAGSQYHSAIRTNHLRILGTRGEIFDDEVRWVMEDGRPAKAKLVYHHDEITGTLRAIDFDGERVYTNPFRWDVAMTEDDIAVCTVMVRFAGALAGGEKHYPYAFRDSYMSIVLTELANRDASATVDVLEWN
ncbi:MAG: Gfo/Idh/MocA family oxidoreductase [Clostridiales bacterium]|nr:Gfo/Idh/MocA family oxidoreductase [Clostridiales bacterium]